MLFFCFFSLLLPWKWTRWHIYIFSPNEIPLVSQYIHDARFKCTYEYEYIVCWSKRMDHTWIYGQFIIAFTLRQNDLGTREHSQRVVGKEREMRKKKRSEINKVQCIFMTRCFYVAPQCTYTIPIYHMYVLSSHILCIYVCVNTKICCLLAMSVRS